MQPVAGGSGKNEDASLVIPDSRRALQEEDCYSRLDVLSAANASAQGEALVLFAARDTER